MIIGACPYCDHENWTAIGSNPPQFSKETCEACGRVYWLLHSRIDPKAYTQDGFDAEWEVDETTRQIRPRATAPSG